VRRRNRYSGKSLPSRLSSLPKSSAPGVTIIRPLCGLDNNLFNALEAAMALDYPKYEVLFALQDERDEAREVVRLMMEKYPHVDARVIISMSALRVRLH
jgi:ceramide glucosyltransferase